MSHSIIMDTISDQTTQFIYFDAHRPVRLLLNIYCHRAIAIHIQHIFAQHHFWRFFVLCANKRITISWTAARVRSTYINPSCILFSQCYCGLPQHTSRQSGIRCIWKEGSSFLAFLSLYIGNETWPNDSTIPSVLLPVKWISISTTLPLCVR